MVELVCCIQRLGELLVDGAGHYTDGRLVQLVA